MPLCPPQIPHGLPWDRTGLNRGQRLPTLSRARLLKAKDNIQDIYITYVYKDSVWSLERTLCALLCTETRIVYCENHMKHVSTQCGENSGLLMLHPLVCIVKTRL